MNLYIDTHYDNLVLALLDNGKLIDKKEVNSGRHSEYAVSLLEELFNDNDISIQDIKGVIVINGPGSFTGVRIGIVMAKMLGYTKDIDVRAISYLEAMALNFDGEVSVGVEDKNGVFVGEFDSNKELKRDYFYLTNREREDYKKEIVLDTQVDIECVCEWVMKSDRVNPHSLKPLYVKRIEVDR